MKRSIIETKEAPAAIGPYSQAVMVAGERTLYISGQIPLDPATGEMAGGGDVRAETVQVLDNLAAVLAAAGMELANVVKTTIFLVDMADFSSVNEVYAARFSVEPPARATVQVAALPKGAKVEIEAIAVG
jgi:2-iminobutanoate/2-iminopropanoate deaminase